MLVFTKYLRVYFHVLRSGQDHISCTLDHDALHHSCICCTDECFVGDLLGSHYDPDYCLCEQHFLDLNLY